MNDPQKREPNRAEVYLATHKHMDEEVMVKIDINFLMLYVFTIVAL